MVPRGLASKEMLFAYSWVGEGKLIPILVQKGPWIPKALLGSFPKGSLSHE